MTMSSLRLIERTVDNLLLVKSICCLVVVVFFEVGVSLTDVFFLLFMQQAHVLLSDNKSR